MDTNDQIKCLASLLREICVAINEYQASDDVVFRAPEGFLERAWLELSTCEDCGRKYGHEHGFPDMIVTNDVWRRISPSGDLSGLLCPSCICGRLHQAGISDVEAAFMSGPVRSVERTLMYALRTTENLTEQMRGSSDG